MIFTRYIFCIFILKAGILQSQSFYPQAINLGIIGEYGASQILGGGGISCADFNNDGYDDLSFATENGAALIFYENKVDHFELVDPPFVNNTFETKQVLWVDYDGDSDKDLFVTSFNGPNYLYENDGNMNFSDVTNARGLPVLPMETFGVNFGDLDQDGDLDLYVTQFGPNSGEFNVLYQYDNVNNVYIDVTASSGTGNGSRQSFCSTFFDFDMDGDLDIFVVNDRTDYENTLYMNTGNMSFIDVSVPAGVSEAINAMNGGIGDPDLDGDFDIYITNIGQSYYYQNNGDLTFSNIASSNNTTFNRWGWGGNFFDFNNDRYEDLYVSYSDPLSSVRENALYVNNQDGTFSEPLFGLKGLAGVDTVATFGNALCDYNNDGNIDIVLSREDGANFELFSNEENNNNNFLKLDLKSNSNNKDALGAMVEAQISGVKSVFYKHCSTAYLAQNAEDINIGMSTYARVDFLNIHWPSGITEYIPGTDLQINALNKIVEGAGVIDSYKLNNCLTNHNVAVDPIASNTYGGLNSVNTSSKVVNNSNVTFKAQGRINLLAGFEVEQNADFLAEINDCGN